TPGCAQGNAPCGRRASRGRGSGWSDVPPFCERWLGCRRHLAPESGRSPRAGHFRVWSSVGYMDRASRRYAGPCSGGTSPSLNRLLTASTRTGASGRDGFSSIMPTTSTTVGAPGATNSAEPRSDVVHRRRRRWTDERRGTVRSRQRYSARVQPLSMKVSTSYALLVLGDPSSAVPDPVPGVLVSRNRSCVVIGCVPDVDGDTDLAVGTIGSLATDDPLVFDGMVDLPTR